MRQGPPPDPPLVSLSKLPATAHQRRVALVVAAVLLVAFGLSAPFANMQLPRYDGYIPAIESMVFVNDLITAILLFSHYAISPSRAVLVLAGAYLYTALIVIPHILTFPGAFTPTGLLGAGPQTSAWLYYLWSAGPPLGAIGYACLAGADRANGLKPRWAIGWTVVVATCLVLAITWITTVESNSRSKRPASVALLICAPNPCAVNVCPFRWKYSATILAFQAPPEAVIRPVVR